MYIKSPKTNRPILVGGPTYKALEKTKKYGKMLKSGEGKKGSATKGWHAAAPKTKTERAEVAKTCGASKCFLDPARLKFPICSTCGGISNKLKKKMCSCSVDCKGVASAKVRANQYHNQGIIDKIVKIEKKNCK